MDIDTYERELMQPEDWPYEVVTHPTLTADMSGNALRVSKASIYYAIFTEIKTPL